MRTYKLAENENDKVKERISNLLKKRGEILFSYIHGSFLKNDFKDIDIAVYLNDEKMSLKYELHLECEIEDAAGFPIDLRILNKAPLSFRFNVIKNGILLFSRNEKSRCDFESLSMTEYHDFNYFMKRYRSEALGIEI